MICWCRLEKIDVGHPWDLKGFPDSRSGQGFKCLPACLQHSILPKSLRFTVFTNFLSWQYIEWVSEWSILYGLSRNKWEQICHQLTVSNNTISTKKTKKSHSSTMSLGEILFLLGPKFHIHLHTWSWKLKKTKNLTGLFAYPFIIIYSFLKILWKRVIIEIS